MLMMLRSNWKAIALILAVLAIFYAGYHVRGAFDAIAAQKLLNEQAEASKAAQDALNAKSATLEANLASERAKSSDLQKRWSKLNAKPHTVCPLSDDAVGLLKDATADDKNPG